jgi:CRP-like cAMP-binding protein
MAKDMDRVEFSKGDLLLDQGAPQSKAFFIADGTIKRERVVNDQSHQVHARPCPVLCYTFLCSLFRLGVLNKPWAKPTLRSLFCRETTKLCSTLQFVQHGNVQHIAMC